MSCLDLECGYMAIGCSLCQTEVFNNALTVQYLEEAQANCNDEMFVGQQPCCSNKIRPAKIGGVCDSWAPDPLSLYPAAVLADGSYSAWWYDPSQDALTGGVLGFVIKRHTLGTADQFEGDTRNTLRRRPRMYRRGVRMGVIEGSVIANSKASASYGIEALRNLLVTPQSDCPCNTDRMSVYRFCCDPGDGLTGAREAYDVGGFDLQPAEELTIHNACSGICDFTLTYEIANPVLYATDQLIEGVVTTSEDCMCSPGCEDVTEYENVEVSEYTAKNTKSIKLVYDQGTGEKLACPVNFLDWSLYDPAVDILEIVAIEGREPVEVVEEDNCNPYRITLDVQDDGTILWEPVMPSRWPTDGSLPDDCEIIVSSIRSSNPNFNPYCEACPNLARQFADEQGLEIDDDGFIVLVPSVITSGAIGVVSSPVADPAPWYIWNIVTEETGNDDVDAYIEYIFGVSGVHPSDVLDCEHASGATAHVGVRIGASGAISYGAIRISGTDYVSTCGDGTCQVYVLSPTGGTSVNGSTALSNGVGWGCATDEVSTGPQPIPPAGVEQTITCDGTDISIVCQPYLTTVYDSPVDPTGAEYVDIALEGNGYTGGGEVTLLSPEQWPDPTEGLPDFTQLVIDGYSSFTPVVETPLSELCAPPIPTDACVEITVLSDDEATWEANGWEVGTLWPYEYDVSQFEVCDQDPSPLVTVTLERRPVALGCSNDGPCSSTAVRRSSLSDISCWEQLCDPVEFRAHEVLFAGSNCNLRYAGRINLVNRTGFQLDKISVDWYRSLPDIDPPSDDNWDFWFCNQVPIATQRITYLANGESFRIDNSNASIFCSGRWEDGIGRLDATFLNYPEFLGAAPGDDIYAVVRHECCDGHGELEVTGDITAIESL